MVSPVLSNLYLDRLDKFVEHELLPRFNTSLQRKYNRHYKALQHRMLSSKRRGDIPSYRTFRKQLQQVPAYDRHDPDFRRLRYARYCDDFLLGFLGPKEEAEQIKTALKQFLAETLHSLRV